MLKPGERICLGCVRIVEESHECPKLAAIVPRELDAPYISSDATPTRSQSQKSR